MNSRIKDSVVGIINDSFLTAFPHHRSSHRVLGVISFTDNLIGKGMVRNIFSYGTSKRVSFFPQFVLL